MKTKPGLGTLDGVYVPTLLTILGVVMYLRLGWVVGNSGLIGALIIIGIAHVITIATTLSMASMLTNIKVGSGGAYAIISQSLGYEMGGAIGIPLYFSQAISVAFYITGFTELWITFFPTHPVWLVALVTWTLLATMSYVSAKLAFKVQYIILAAVVLSLLSFFFGQIPETASVSLLGDFRQVSFWGTFAIFFPAVTGILTGATMSGELMDPRKSIIRGTLAAVFTGLVVYIGVAIMFSYKSDTETLIGNTMLILDISYSKMAVVAGIMGAVLSSALSTLVSAPRTLAALAGNRSVPFYSILNKTSKNGEPRTAIILSSLLSLGVLLLGNLDSLASLLTLFFLATYAIINLVVLLEQSIGIISFRPSFKLSIIIPIIGFLGCVFSMFLINKWFLLLTLVVIIFIYYTLQRKNIISPWGDIRGGIFRSIAEWAAQKSAHMPYHPKLWKPSILIPVESPNDFKRVSSFVRSFIYPSGRAYYLTIGTAFSEELSQQIKSVLEPLKEDRLFTQELLIHSTDFKHDLPIVLQSVAGNFLSPNSIFFTISDEEKKKADFKIILNNISNISMGLMCLRIHPKYNFGQQRNICIWLREKSPNYNLAVLSALQIGKNWGATVNLCRVVDHENQIKKATNELTSFIDDARLPTNTNVIVKHGKFGEIIHTIPCDLNILGLPNSDANSKYENMMRVIDFVPTSVLFVSDSGLENALV